ncbi:MAG: nicotinate-nucleotide adenylyltransferase [Moraxellaceae bacterium]|nr:nicotinate-nucleotide adenylyltransferase [Moraxellaceae bacterium]MDZ4386892.1 nicotinate-nucleotide adenylyltransferase [Moraxellaceae bacterium]
MLMLFGGSFDPVHKGHREVATAAQQQLGAHQVVWLPNYRSPLKSTSHTKPEHRQHMLELMLAHSQQSSWQLDLNELHSAEPCYTIDSLRRWRQQLGPSHSLVFLLGQDSLQQLNKWRDWQQLTELAHLAVVSRTSLATAGTDELKNWLKNRLITSPQLLQSRPFGSIIELNTPFWDISSTDLRQALADQRPLDDWLDPPVRDYILKLGLYRHLESNASS